MEVFVDQVPVKSVARRRGRPTGKNRVPLSLEARRARNAQYERERRNEMAHAMCDLAEAAGVNPELPNTEIMAEVISQLHMRNNPDDDLDNLRRINRNLAAQIEELERRVSANEGLLRNRNMVHGKVRKSQRLSIQRIVKKKPMVLNNLGPIEVQHQLSPPSEETEETSEQMLSMEIPVEAQEERSTSVAENWPGLEDLVGNQTATPTLSPDYSLDDLISEYLLKPSQLPHPGHIDI